MERCVKTQLLEKNMLNLRSLDPLIDLAFEEDIGIGDITTEATVPSTQKGVGTPACQEWWYCRRTAGRRTSL